jgi:hypothetical protein
VLSHCSQSNLISERGLEANNFPEFDAYCYRGFATSCTTASTRRAVESRSSLSGTRTVGAGQASRLLANKGLQLSSARIGLPCVRGVWHDHSRLRRGSGGPGSRS